MLTFTDLVICTTLITQVNGKTCANLLPGLNKQRNGVDIATVDYLPPQTFGHNNGFKSPIFDLSCNEGKKKHINGIAYDVPDQVDAVVLNSRGTLVGEAELYKVEMDYIRRTSGKMNLNIVDGMLRTSATYQYLQRVIDSGSRYVEQINATVIIFIVRLQSHISLNDHVINEIENLPMDLETGFARYNEFIDKYGTHYIYRGTYGGAIIMTLETQKTYYKKFTDIEVLVQAESKFLEFLKVYGVYSDKTSSVSQEFNKATKESKQFYGGSAGLITTKEEFQKWQKSVPEYPWLLNGNVEELWSRIENVTKQNNMKRMVAVMVDKTYIKDLKTELLHHYSYMFREFEERINTFLADPLLSHSSVVKLAGEIADRIKQDNVISDWFKEIQLCYKWIGSSSSKQCPLSTEERCVKQGELPPITINEKGIADARCVLSWVLKVASSSPWLPPLRLCSNWCPSQSEGQCTDNSLLCFRLTELTNNCQNSGLCQNELEIPKNTPGWTKEAKACFNWHHGKFDQPKKLCLIPNTNERIRIIDKKHETNGTIVFNWQKMISLILICVALTIKEFLFD